MEQRAQVKEAVRRGPRASGYHASVWTTKWVRHFLCTRLRLVYCRELVLQLLHALGFRLRRLRHRHLTRGGHHDRVAGLAGVCHRFAA